MENLINELKNQIYFPLSITLSNSYKVEGYIVDVKYDYIHFRDERGTSIFIPVSSMRDIYKSSKSFKMIPSYNDEVHDMYFKDLLLSMKDKWLYIKRTLLDSVEGILTEVEMDHVLLVKGEMLITLPISEIAAVLDSGIDEDDSSESEENEDSQGEESETSNDANESKEAEEEKTENKDEAKGKKKQDSDKEAQKAPMSTSVGQGTQPVENWNKSMNPNEEEFTVIHHLGTSNQRQKNNILVPYDEDDKTTPFNRGNMKRVAFRRTWR